MLLRAALLPLWRLAWPLSAPHSLELVSHHLRFTPLFPLCAYTTHTETKLLDWHATICPIALPTRRHGVCTMNLAMLLISMLLLATGVEARPGG